MDQTIARRSGMGPNDLNMPAEEAVYRDDGALLFSVRPRMKPLSMARRLLGFLPRPCHWYNLKCQGTRPLSASLTICLLAPLHCLIISCVLLDFWHNMSIESTSPD